MRAFRKYTLALFVDWKTGWAQTLAVYYLVETFGADLGIALMSTITRTVVKAKLQISLGRSGTTDRVRTPDSSGCYHS